MADFSVAALARKWCPWGHDKPGENPDHGCVCVYIKAAIREALEEAEKIPLGRGCTKVACGPHEHSYAGCPQNIAAAIAALRT